MSLPDFIGDAEAKVAAKLIAAAADDGAKAVLGDVDAHKNAWAAKSNEERTTLSQSAAGWAIRQAGHRVNCPSCASQALVVGEPVTAPTQKLEDGEITETQEYLPNRFECIACGLKINGFSRLAAVGLESATRRPKSMTQRNIMRRRTTMKAMRMTTTNVDPAKKCAGQGHDPCWTGRFRSARALVRRGSIARP
ncbi:hypothetical protein [Mesorhizobium sp. M0199]|uniref:hypothetical protein n=1 Tax=Mesorhizobium sp. M0199 TaxID=2956911 RepID=UPI00333B948B